MGWIEGPDIPAHLEGKLAWKFVEGQDRRFVIDLIPRGFSRDRHHCGGVFFWPLDPPEPPPQVGDQTRQGMVVSGKVAGAEFWRLLGSQTKGLSSQ